MFSGKWLKLKCFIHRRQSPYLDMDWRAAVCHYKHTLKSSPWVQDLFMKNAERCGLVCHWKEKPSRQVKTRIQNGFETKKCWRNQGLHWFESRVFWGNKGEEQGRHMQMQNMVNAQNLRIMVQQIYNSLSLGKAFLFDLFGLQFHSLLMAMFYISS